MIKKILIAILIGLTLYSCEPKNEPTIIINQEQITNN